MIYEPSTREVVAYKIFGNTLLIPYNRSFLKSLELKGNERILEYGSGPGFISKLISRKLKSGKLTCYDISKVWITIAQDKLSPLSNVEFNFNDLSNLKSNSYDKIIIHYVFHDVPANERKSQAEKLYDLLKKDGELIIREPIAFYHGVSVEEIKAIMKMVGLKEIKTGFLKALLMGKMFSGVYKK